MKSCDASATKVWNICEERKSRINSSVNRTDLSAMLSEPKRRFGFDWREAATIVVDTPGGTRDVDAKCTVAGGVGVGEGRSAAGAVETLGLSAPGCVVGAAGAAGAGAGAG